MAQKQKTYNAEFKREAVRLLETSGKSGAVIAQEQGISDDSLYTWRKQFVLFARCSTSCTIRPV